MIALLLATMALAGPQPVVAVGDGLVAGSPPVETAAGPGGWVAALADCLEERAPGQWTVVDRTEPGDTAATARARVEDVRSLNPALVVVSVGAVELSNPAADAGAFQIELTELTMALRASRDLVVMLVGVIPPTLSQLGPDAGDQAAVDARTTTWNSMFAEVASASSEVTHLDLWTQWPREEAARADLTSDGVHLSDQGHARVAAAVCDAVLAR